MIEIKVDETEIRVDGHAGFGPPGQDIVCAGVSALFQTLIWSIEDLTDARIEYDLMSGKAWLKHEESLTEDVNLLVRSFFIGIEAIRDTYPEFVRIVRIDEDKGNGLGTQSEWSGTERMEK